ncbi:MAG: gliding motility lipoprotein GldH [Cyclobacteriaceae bacterium]|nr:gliding motility lipoprotein GldH [Cyclobacteriaceae bacterium]
MKIFFKLPFIIILFFGINSCDDTRIYEQNSSFDNQFWMADSSKVFEIDIVDESLAYNVYLNMRNSSTYPYYNIYVNYSLYDSLGSVIVKKLENNHLFEPKSGRSLGQSGIGDVFDHQFLILKNHEFNHSGKFTFELQQYMRTDTLKGVLSVGIRVENTTELER